MIPVSGKGLPAVSQHGRWHHIVGVHSIVRSHKVREEQRAGRSQFIQPVVEGTHSILQDLTHSLRLLLILLLIRALITQSPPIRFHPLKILAPFNTITLKIKLPAQVFVLQTITPSVPLFHSCLLLRSISNATSFIPSTIFIEYLLFVRQNAGPREYKDNQDSHGPCLQ
jgi:hypothetical protein